MLILTRRPNEIVVIGNSADVSQNVTVTVLGVKGNQVRLGIKAPKEVHVDRQEIWERKQAERAA